MSAVYNQGCEAWKNGESLDANPYELNSQDYCDWINGWNDAWQEGAEATEQ